MGYQKATAYETLLEFSFEAGKLLSKQNLSVDNATKRGAFKQRYETGDFLQKFEESFSLDIDLE